MKITSIFSVLLLMSMGMRAGDEQWTCYAHMVGHAGKYATRDISIDIDPKKTLSDLLEALFVFHQQYIPHLADKKKEDLVFVFQNAQVSDDDMAKPLQLLTDEQKRKLTVKPRAYSGFMIFYKEKENVG